MYELGCPASSLPLVFAEMNCAKHCLVLWAGLGCPLMELRGLGLGPWNVTFIRNRCVAVADGLPWSFQQVLERKAMRGTLQV